MSDMCATDSSIAPNRRWIHVAVTGVGVVGLVMLGIYNARMRGGLRAASGNIGRDEPYYDGSHDPRGEIAVPSDPRPGTPPAAPARPPEVASAPVASATPDRCSMEALSCSSITIPRAGRTLGTAAQKARIAGRNEEALCLAQQVDQNGCLKGASAPCTSDVRLAGAMSYEQAQAWKALGCLDAAGRAVTTSIGITPHGGRTWQMVCELCNEISKAGHLQGEACVDCSWPELKTDELLKAEHAAMARRDGHALAGLLSPEAFAIGIAAPEVAVGRDAIEAQLRSDLNSASTGPIKVRSKYLKVGRERSGTWIAEELELVEPDGSSRRIAITQLAAHVGDAWTIVAMHWGIPLANDTAAELAAGGDLPVPAPIEASSGDTAGLADALRGYLGSLKSVAEAFAERDDAFNLGSAPGEQVVGGPAIRRALGSMRAKVHVHDAIRVALGSSWDPQQADAPWMGWGAANVDLTVGKAGKSVTLTYRLLAVLTRNASGWQIVQAHWSNAIPSPANPEAASDGDGSAATADHDAVPAEAPVVPEPAKPADPRE
jgi:ketosteroid isomerase-like protein